jgi:C1A family cysteine protease
MAGRFGGYGLVADLPDARDLLAGHEATDKLPPKVDLRTDKRMPPVWDQGQLGSCTAHGIGAALVFHEVVPEMPSRLFIYYNERVIEKTVESDSGAQIRDGIKSVSKQGVCPESEWAYDITKFKKKPAAKCYTDAKHEVALTYQRVTVDPGQVRAQLANDSLVVIGFTVYSSFESDAVAKSGEMPMPDTKTEQLLGGHCVAVVGYDDSVERLIVRNSWGTGWGQDGYFTMPYAYLTTRGVSSDFWTITATGSH